MILPRVSRPVLHKKAVRRGLRNLPRRNIIALVLSLSAFFAYNGGYSGVTFDRNGRATLTPGFHDVNGSVYYADRYGNLVMNADFGAFHADSTGALTQMAASYQIPNVPYLNQIDGINAWVECEATAALPGLWVKGFAQNVWDNA